MAEGALASRLKDGLITIGAIWLILTLAALPCLLLGVGTLAGALVSLAAYLALLGVYALRTGPGQRSAFPAFFAGAVSYPAYLIAIWMAVETIGRTEFLVDAALLLSNGVAIGFQVEGGADTPMLFYLGPWTLNFLIPIILVLMLRAHLRDRAERPSDG